MYGRIVIYRAKINKLNQTKLDIDKYNVSYFFHDNVYEHKWVENN